MGMPSTLKNFNLFNDATSYQGQVEEVKLPELQRKIEEWRAGGMNGPVPIDLGMEKIELEYTVGGLDAIAYKQFGKGGINGVPIRFAGAYQADDTQAVQAVEVTVRGRHTGIDSGSAKAGDMNKTVVKVMATYYKMRIDNQDVIEIDFINMIEKIDGVDVLADQRRAIGLA